MVAVACVAGALALPAHAWDDEGHEIVAWLAYQRMTPGARAEAVKLLRKHPQLELLLKGKPKDFDEDLYLFMRAATWPDMMRSAALDPGLKEHHRLWHFIDVPVETEGVVVSQPVLVWHAGTDPKNIVQALAKCELELGSPHVSEEEKAKALCWELHLVGDIHQPLHAVALFSEMFPGGDHGGNSFGVTEDGEPWELHAYWDRLLGSSKSFKRVASDAQKIGERADLKREAFKAVLGAHTTAAEWAAESFELAKTVAYDGGKLKGEKIEDSRHLPQDAPSLPAGYHERAEETAKKQASLAGWRLADAMEEVFGVKDAGKKPDAEPAR